MLNFGLDDIHIGVTVKDKRQAIAEIAQSLVQADYTSTGYEEGMLTRENISSTYLGNGVAIPHGTPETRHLVKRTGIQIFQFPEGVVWGDEGQRAYVAIGIAASSDEHLTLLRQLTHILSQEGLEEKLAHITSAEQLLQLFTHTPTSKKSFSLDNTLISLEVPSHDLLTLQAINIGKLQQIKAINHNFIADNIEQTILSLAPGIWLSDAAEGSLTNAVAIARSSPDPQAEENKTTLLLTIAIHDNSVMQPFFDRLATLLLTKQLQQLSTANTTEALRALLEPDHQTATTAITPHALTAEFTVLNPHGLHTRPASLLVKLIKTFNSTIMVANLDGSQTPVKGTNLMKIVGLGARKGNRLRFTAEGVDAKEALEAIGKAMQDGLGEQIE